MKFISFFKAAAEVPPSSDVGREEVHVDPSSDGSGTQRNAATPESLMVGVLLLSFHAFRLFALLGALANVIYVARVNSIRWLTEENDSAFNLPNAMLSGGRHLSATKRWKPPAIPEDEGGHCRCVHCESDDLCGGLWKANRFAPTINEDAALHDKKIHVVVSHCKRDLHWMANFTQGYELSSVHVVSKCGEPVEGAPDGATIEELPNVGRCDHSYAHYISNVLDDRVAPGEEGQSIVVFLKDDKSDENLHQPGRWVDFASMIRIASSANGFACGIDVETAGGRKCSYSAYHDTAILSGFAMKQYQRKLDRGYQPTGADFESGFVNLRAFFETMTDGRALPELAQVCYGGVFAASYASIRRVDARVWRRVEFSLSRANSIEEGHHMERCWGLLLATPLRRFQVEALRDFANGHFTMLTGRDLPGMLLKVKERKDFYIKKRQKQKLRGGLF